MILPRRRFLQVLTGVIAAPAVVKADSLMRVFAPPKPKLVYFDVFGRDPREIELMIRPPLIVQDFAGTRFETAPGAVNYAIPERSADFKLMSTRERRVRMIQQSLLAG